MSFANEEAFHQSGLARAVLSAECVNSSFADSKINIAQRLNARE